MTPFAEQLRAHLSAHQQPEQALAMEAYMKNKFAFFGMKSEPRRTLLKQFILENPPPQYPALETVALELWALPERQLQYCAIELLAKTSKSWTVETINLFEKLIIEKSWWDSVDGISSALVAVYFKRFPEQIAPVTTRWMASKSIWLQRVCLIFQLSYSDKTDTALLFGFIRELAKSREFFIEKAIGWALRQYARTDAEAVKTFVATTRLRPLSIRESLKHLG